MNKKPGSTLSKSINGSRSCYITVKRLALLSVETILFRTQEKHFSNNILTCFWSLFKSVNLLAKRQEKGICLMFERNIAHLDYGRELRTLTFASAERLKSFFVQATFTRTLCKTTIHVANENFTGIVETTVRGECATHRNCFQYFTLVCIDLSVLVQTVNFAMVKLDNFCKKRIDCRVVQTFR